MSAWDIAGAVVWTPTAVALWAGFLRTNMSGFTTFGTLLALATVFGPTLGAVYCIARLCGAHA